MIRGLSHISLSSKNLNKVIEFYVKLLGFKVVHKFTNSKKQVFFTIH